MVEKVVRVVAPTLEELRVKIEKGDRVVGLKHYFEGVNMVMEVTIDDE